MAGLPYVFTINFVAAMLNEDWLREISANMDPEQGYF
jgi:hypothetical protein